MVPWPTVGRVDLYDRAYPCEWWYTNGRYWPTRIDWDKGMFNLVKNPKAGECPARRCQDPPMAGIAPEDNPHALCERHLREWLENGSPDLSQPAPAAPSTTRAPRASKAEIAPAGVDESAIEAKREEARAYLEACRQFQIDSQDSADTAAKMMAEFKRLRNELEDQRTGITKPMNAALRKVNGLFKPVIEYYDSCERALKDSVARFLGAQRAAQDAALSEVAAGNEAALAVAHGQENIETPATLSPSSVWVVESVDPAQIPREYMLPDMRKIAAVVKAAGKDHGIPGVIAKQEIRIANRG